MANEIISFLRITQFLKILFSKLPDIFIIILIDSRPR